MMIKMIQLVKQVVPASTLLRQTHLWQSSNKTTLRLFQNSAIVLSHQKLPTLTLYTKEVCPLCDDAKDLLERYKHRFKFEEVNITAPENNKWMKYKYDIPVFHFNGEFLMKHRVDTAKLENALSDFEIGEDKGTWK